VRNSPDELTPGFRFPKSTRLLTATDYSDVFDAVDFRISSHHFLLLVKQSPTDRSRLGLIIAKKHVKLAVQRNRLKRLSRESFRTNNATFPNFDLVLLAKKGAGTRSNNQCVKELEFIWRKFKNRAKT